MVFAVEDVFVQVVGEVVAQAGESDLQVVADGCGQACGQCTGNNEICDLPTGQCVDAGELPSADAGFDGGTGGAGGGGEEVKGGCGCGAAPPPDTYRLADLRCGV